jgi:gamma-glutamyltranspeptidase/glutathione hydrolase
MQVVANVVGRDMNVKAAVEAPRIHAEAGVVHCEDPAVADALENEGRAVVRWKKRNLYFGGVSAVDVRNDAAHAAGDLRRGGSGIVA